MTARLRLLAPAEWPAWGSFVARHNRRADGRVRCLHSEQGDSADSHAAELRRLPADGAVFAVAEADDGTPLGWIGAEFDAAAGRAWLRGPLTAVPGGDLPAALIAHLVQALPAVRRFDAFPQHDEAALVQPCLEAGFTTRATYHVMRADTAPELATQAAHQAIGALQAGAPVLPDLLALHDRLFPATYLRGEALPASLDADHQLFAAVQHGRLGGYVYVQHRRDDNDGYVDYLGVAEHARGQGLGRALLLHALQWALGERRLPCVYLTVRSDSAPALGLYRSAGFREVAAGLQLCLERP